VLRLHLYSQKKLNIVTCGAGSMTANVNSIGVYMIKKMANTFISTIESLNKKDNELSKRQKEIMLDIQAVVCWFVTFLILFSFGVEFIKSLWEGI